MYLSKLELHGFKSFAQKTAVSFDPGITAIVGPNGCGKSNVIDAVRWVLGEQRARLLRSDKMENVIFNGTDQKRALGMAEVSLTIENTRGVLPTEYSEVEIARRLYRSGESEYLLNGSQCRLKDILDLFMDTGMGAGAYSVIELKMIEDILSDKAEDRRRLFEEAAGVTKYKMRRRQALNKLDSTQADLTRLTDLVDEIERNVRSLQRQAQKAARYQRVADRLKTLELAVAAWDYDQLGNEQRALDVDSRRVRTEVEGLTAQVSSGEATLESHRTALVSTEQKLAAHQKTFNAHADTIRKLEAELRVGEERRSSNIRALDRLTREADADATRKTELETEQSSVAKLIEETTQALEISRKKESETTSIRDRLSEAAESARKDLADTRKETAAKTKAASDAWAALNRFKDRRTLQEQARERLQEEIQTVGRQVDGAKDAEKRETEKLRVAQNVLNNAESELQNAKQQEETRRAAVEQADEQVRQALVARDTALAEVSLLESLVAEDNGGNTAVAFLADNDEWTSEVLTVADLISCEETYRVALDTALGEWAGYLVVQTEREAEEGIGRLRVSEQGKATFIVLDRLSKQARTERSATPAGSMPATQVARVADSRYEPLLSLLLQNVFLVESLDEARKLRDSYPVARFVTLDGDWTSAEGVVSGGKGGSLASAGRFGRKERLERAEKALSNAAKRLEEAEHTSTLAKSALDAIAVTGAEEAVARARSVRDDAHNSSTRASVERQAMEERLSRATAQKASLEDSWTEEPDLSGLLTAAEAENASAKATTEKLERAEAAFEKAEQERRDADTFWNEARLELANVQNRLESHQRDLVRIEKTLGEIERRSVERAGERTSIETALSEGEATKHALAARLEEEKAGTSQLKKSVEDAEQALLQARALIADTEKTLRTIRQIRDEALQRQNSADLRLTEIITRQDAIVERLEEEHGVTLDQASAYINQSVGEQDSAFDSDAARQEIPELKNRIRGLGAVNALALESFEEEQERLEFLSKQQSDLQEAETTLLSTIDEINTTAARRFEETFGQVREAFQKLFSDLFGQNAKADLVIEGDDLLEAPIEIKARPKGKKPSTINQLSGGEKTLTAIALLFAIYLVKPSPFCILDEVDAPLDDANIRRFMDLIRSFADSTQFILVTHNKLTMEAADRMYGITMPEPGISRLVGVRFGDVVEEELEEIA